jgi:hypothetical protein
MRSTENITTKSSGGPRTRLRSLLTLVITALALTAGMTASPTVASAESCDGTYVTMAILDGGTVVAVLDSRDPHDVTLPIKRYNLAAGGTIRPNGFAVFSFYRDTPTGSALLAQVRKTAGPNGVIREEPASSFDTGAFARPGDRLRVQGFWETNAFCTPSRALDATLGWINLV